MPAANSRSHALDTHPVPTTDRAHLFKDDRPRRIDRYISFFGDEREGTLDVCGEALLESLSAEHWSER